MNRKRVLCIVLVFQVVWLLPVSCVSSSVSAARTITLDEAIHEAAENIESRFEYGAIIALLNFDSPSEGFSVYVLEELSDLLVNRGKLVVVDRKELDLIRQEEQFQLSGEVSDETARAIGRKLGAQAIVSGSVSSMGISYRFRIKTLDVESAAIAASSAADIPAKDGKVLSLLGGAKPVVETYLENTRQGQSVSVVVERPVPDGFVLIKGGTFMMGSPASELGHSDSEAQHRVTLSSFYMGKYEVTQKEYQEIMGTNPSQFKGDNLPVEQVTWYQVLVFCNRLSIKEGLTPAYSIKGSTDPAAWGPMPMNSSHYNNEAWSAVQIVSSSNGYRLPTEAQWEYACRAGTTTPFSTGNNITTSQANYNGDWPYNNNAKGEFRRRTMPVGSFAPNPWGLYDMHGNVKEFCWDWHGSYFNSAQTDPQGPDTETIGRIIRGGSYLDHGEYLRSAFRKSTFPLFGDFFIGFRLVRPY